MARAGHPIKKPRKAPEEEEAPHDETPPWRWCNDETPSWQPHASRDVPQTQAPPLVMVGVSGPSGVGKSSLARGLAKTFASPIGPIELDNFRKKPRFMPKTQNGSPNWEAPGGIDFEKLCKYVDNVKAEIVAQPSEHLPDTTIIVVEGFVLFYNKAMCERLHVHLWVEADFHTCLQRRKARNSHNAKKPDPNLPSKYRNTVWPQYQLYRKQQLNNVPTAVHLDAHVPAKKILQQAVAACLEYCTRPRNPRKKLMLNPTSWKPYQLENMQKYARAEQKPTQKPTQKSSSWKCYQLQKETAAAATTHIADASASSAQRKEQVADASEWVLQCIASTAQEIVQAKNIEELQRITSKLKEQASVSSADRQEPLACRPVLTAYCGVVISLGKTTDIHAYIREQIPEARNVIVDVTKWLRAPLMRERSKGACFPDDNVVASIQRQEGFDEVVEICEAVLRQYGIVLVVATGGNHRAPTIADSMKSRGMYVLHATLFGRPSFQCSHVATLVHACLKCSSSIEFYNGLVHESKDPQYKTPLCVGWFCPLLVNPDTNEVDTSIPPIPDGSEVQVLTVNGYESIVRDTATGHTYALPVTWLVPKSVYTRMETC